MSLSEFFRQFWPALLATVIGGFIILAATSYIQNRPSQSGTILYFQEFVRTEVEPEPDSKRSRYELGRAGSVIRFMNIGDTDLKNFQIAISGFSPHDDVRPDLDVDLENALTSNPVSAKLIDSNGVLRLNFSRFDANGQATIKFDAQSILSLKPQSADAEIRLVPANTFDLKIRENTPGWLVLLVSLAVGLLVALIQHVVFRKEKSV